jgi:hypothetical protein
MTTDEEIEVQRTVLSTRLRQTEIEIRGCWFRATTSDKNFDFVASASGEAAAQHYRVVSRTPAGKGIKEWRSRVRLQQIDPQ